MNKEIFNIVEEAREKLGLYCISICKSLCCRKGSLILLNKEEVEIIAGFNIESFLKLDILNLTLDGNYTYHSEKVVCRHLNDAYTCNIYLNKNRPKVCHDFPIFIFQNQVLLSSMCPAIKEGNLDFYFDKIRKLGVSVI